MALDLSRLFNKARDYHKNNPNSNIYDFLNSSNYYKQLSDFDKSHAIKILNKIFNESLPEDEKTSDDQIFIHEELK